VVIDIPYTTLSEKMPQQNALFLFIPASYVAGWTLTNVSFRFCISSHGEDYMGDEGDVDGANDGDEGDGVHHADDVHDG